MVDDQVILPNLNVYFFIWVFGFSVLIRLILCLTKAIECKQGGLDTKDKRLSEQLGFWKALGLSFISNSKDENLDDYLLPSFIGLIELMILPILIYSNLYKVIGAWIAIKAFAQWKRWELSRTIYNRFVLGNLLVILFSFILYTKF